MDYANANPPYNYYNSLLRRPVYSQPSTANNTTYDDYLAIWDGYNGTSTGANIVGTPPGWDDDYNYWSATPAASGHANLGLGYGYVTYYYDHFDSSYVAVEVL